MPITALPSLDRTSATFKTDLDSYFLSALPAFSTEANALQTDVNAKQVTASAAAATAATQAENASSSASAAAASVATVGAAWVSGATYAIGDMRYSPINFATYRRKTAGAGATDPSADSTNWAASATSTPPALILLATITPTVAASVDFLNVFSSTYDNYLIVGQGLCPSANDQLRMQFAVAGSTDTGSNYYAAPNLSTTPVTVATANATIVANTGTAGKGCNFEVMVGNANDTGNLKTAIAKSVGENNTANNFSHSMNSTSYIAANAVSGVRFLWNAGSNFKAQGKIYVYGYSNT